MLGVSECGSGGVHQIRVSAGGKPLGGCFG